MHACMYCCLTLSCAAESTRLVVIQNINNHALHSRLYATLHCVFALWVWVGVEGAVTKRQWSGCLAHRAM